MKIIFHTMLDAFCSDETGCHSIRVEKVCMVILEIVKCLVTIAIALEFFNILNVVGLLESRGGTLCHHQSDRCFSDSAGPWSVCARCTGMYFGWLLTTTLGQILKAWVFRPRVILVAAALFVLAVVSALMERFGVFSASNDLRACFGVPLGIFPSMLLIFVISHLKKSNSTSPQL